MWVTVSHRAPHNSIGHPCLLGPSPHTRALGTRRTQPPQLAFSVSHASPLLLLRLCRDYDVGGGGGGSWRRRGSAAADVTEEQQHKARLLELLEPRAALTAGGEGGPGSL